ncbi:MAG: poly-gamma-glutamate hydrolase family protein [Thermodesulfobacteriota bacterium]
MMVKAYRSFGELTSKETEGRDYTIEMSQRNGPVLVMAPHGGKIEPGTTEAAEAIAGDDHSFYSFQGIKSDGNGVLHLQSHLFDEPRAIEILKGAEIVVTVHGHADREDGFVMVGGLNPVLKSEIERELGKAGFQTREATERLKAIDPRNICNRGHRRMGVQLEISRKLRDSFRADGGCLQKFADAIRRGIGIYIGSQDVKAPRVS